MSDLEVKYFNIFYSIGNRGEDDLLDKLVKNINKELEGTEFYSTVYQGQSGKYFKIKMK